jgi:hypothetical protein
MRDTIDMAREAGLLETSSGYDVWYVDNLKDFEALVRADEAAKYTWDVHSCGPTCTKAACVATRKAVEAEREACAKVCEAKIDGTPDYNQGAWDCAESIRARGNT